MVTDFIDEEYHQIRSTIMQPIQMCECPTELIVSVDHIPKDQKSISEKKNEEK
jgi:hypothetical protein